MLGTEEEEQVIQALFLAAAPRSGEAKQAAIRDVMALKTRIINLLQNAPEGLTVQEIIDTLLDDDKIKEVGSEL